MKVVVVGGGAAGCAAAYTLRKRGHDVELFEASDAVGGRIRTIERDGFTIETGAIYLLSLYTRTRALLEEMGRMPEVRAWSPVAGLFDGTTLHSVRYDFLPSFFKLPLLDRSDKLRLVRKGAALTLRPGPDPYETDSLASYDTGEDMETWSRRELGDHVHEYLVRPLIEPTFGVECSEIAAPYLQGALKRAYKVGFSVPKAGMSDICAALTSDVGVHLDTRVTAVDVSSTGATVRLADGSTHHADAVVVATDSVTAAAILGDSIDPQTTESLTESPYATMAHVVLRWLDDPWPDSTEEMLLPVGPGAHPVVGIIARGKDSPSPVPAGAKALSVYLSDTLTREVDDEGAVTAALESAEAMLGKAPAPDYADVYRFERALALSPPGHYATMQGVRRAVPPRLALAGDYLAHLGVESAVVSGERAAHELDAVLREHTM